MLWASPQVTGYKLVTGLPNPLYAPNTALARLFCLRDQTRELGAKVSQARPSSPQSPSAGREALFTVGHVFLSSRACR